MRNMRAVRSRLIGLITVAIAALCATLIAAPSASATYLGTNLIQSRYNGLCLGGNTTGLYLTGCRFDYRDPYQNWIANTTGNRPNGYDQVVLRNNATGLYLTAYYAGILQTTADIRFTVGGWNGSNPDVYFDGIGSNWQDVMLQAYGSWTDWNHSCLDANNVYAGTTCSSGYAPQHWDFIVK